MNRLSGRAAPKSRDQCRSDSLMLPSFVLEPSNARMHGGGATGYGAIRIINLGTVKMSLMGTSLPRKK
jgi:hypothetical protein